MQHAEPFDVARIVPSVRDLPASLAMRRRALVLVPLLDEQDPASALVDLERLRDSVRAVAISTPSPASERLARASGDLPLLALAPCRAALDCQRARFHGADGVCLDAGADWPSLALAARSMRMMPLVRAADAASPVVLAEQGAPAIVVAGSLDAIATEVASIDRRVVLVADVSDRAVGKEELRALLGVVDAAIVAPALHRLPAFLDWIEELDG